MSVDATQEGGIAAAVEGYADEHRPLGSYALLVGGFNAAFAAALVAANAAGRKPPERVSLGDLLLFGVATHKLSRTLTKDKATSFLRAPFTEYQGPGGPAELEECPRGHGMRYAIGELAVCPYCVGEWIAAGFAGGLVVNPRWTRLVASVFATKAISDFLQLAYAAADERT